VLNSEKTEKTTLKTPIEMSKNKQKSKKTISKLQIMAQNRHLNEFLGCL